MFSFDCREVGTLFVWKRVSPVSLYGNTTTALAYVFFHFLIVSNYTDTPSIISKFSTSTVTISVTISLTICQ